MITLDSIPQVREQLTQMAMERNVGPTEQQTSKSVTHNVDGKSIIRYL